MNIKDTAAKKIIITAHRGQWGGNIPCNTIAAYDIAISHGADMIEVDANMSADGTLYSFHPNMEKRMLGIDKFIPDLTDGEVRSLRHLNYDGAVTQFGIPTLEEIFTRYKDRAYINIDKFWLYPREISELIRKHGMQDQIIVKTSPDERLFDIIETYAPDIAYLPILKEDGGVHDMLKKRNVNYVGAELVFDDETRGVGTKEYIDRLHSDGKLVWINSIIYNYKKQLSAGHSDDLALTADAECGWGWLADRGYDIIQTDWTLPLSLFLEKTGRLYK